MKTLLNYIVNREHHQFRKDFPQYDNIAEEYQKEVLEPKERMTRRFEILSSLETPIFLPDEKICFLRTVKKIPDCFTEDEWRKIKEKHYIHELGYMSNLSPDYEGIIKDGLLKRRETADEYGKRVIDAIIRLSDRYKKEAEKQGKSVFRDTAQLILERLCSFSGLFTIRYGLKAIIITQSEDLINICIHILKKIWKTVFTPKKLRLSF